jgi:predicted  nucleic acid-binding Zn-ribbon protein
MDTHKLANELLTEWASTPTALVTRADAYDIEKHEYKQFKGVSIKFKSGKAEIRLKDKLEEKEEYVLVEIEDGKFYVTFIRPDTTLLVMEKDYTDKEDVIKALENKTLIQRFKIFSAK